jgi:hypothetical protein
LRREADRIEVEQAGEVAVLKIPPSRRRKSGLSTLSTSADQHRDARTREGTKVEIAIHSAAHGVIEQRALAVDELRRRPVHEHRTDR